MTDEPALRTGRAKARVGAGHAHCMAGQKPTRTIWYGVSGVGGVPNRAFTV